ncbi:hypothetical protein [Cesiribacter sp. SM1]|uniref:hypothetical protein n=1 Tax=Cesiribacter sp. SM1 TaxID=2861196 RepID=UPI001CD403BD|nr:hypothetical protein [Cesiribacter sp. SM1]
MTPKQISKPVVSQPASAHARQLAVKNNSIFKSSLENRTQPFRLSCALLWLCLLCVVLMSCEDDTAIKPALPAPDADVISGTVTAASGQTVADTYVLACFNNDCDDNRTKFVQLEQSQQSAAFEIKELAAGKYGIIAWKDNNANLEVDAGDAFDFLSDNGSQPKLVAPPLEHVALQLKPFAGSGGAVGAGTISGSVSVPAGASLGGTLVIACQWNGSECVEASSQVTEVAGNGTYTFSGLASKPFFVIAWQDLNESGEIDNGDLYGIHTSGGATASVLPPSGSIDIAMALISNQGNSGGSSGNVPAALLGDWIMGTASPVDFYNPATGSWGAPSGKGLYLQLHADGSFALSTVIQVTNYNCTTQIATFYRGAVVVEGVQLTLEPSYTRQKHHSNCYTHLNSDKEVPSTPLPFSWRMDEYANGADKLVLIWPDGEEYEFSRP